MAVAGTLLPVAVKQRFAHRPAFASGIGVTGHQHRRRGLVGARRADRVGAGRAGAARSRCSRWRRSRSAPAGSALSRGAWERALRRAARRGCRCGARSCGRSCSRSRCRPAVYYGLVAWIADVYQERGWSDETSGAVLAVMGVASVPGGADRAVARRPDGLAARRGCGSRPAAWASRRSGSRRSPAAAFAWAVLTAASRSARCSRSRLTMCLDVARGPADAGAAAALMFLAGYPIAALGPARRRRACATSPARSTRACGRCSATALLMARGARAADATRGCGRRSA